MNAQGPRNGFVLNDEDWIRLAEELSLSPQELKVVQHILAGEKLTTIAERLQLGLGTVKTYSQRVYRKLQVSTHCELALAVLTTYVSVSHAHVSSSSD
jgi:DNA-binding NarL/FixJ family response regulator